MVFGEAWASVMVELGGESSAAETIGAELIERHREPQRHYHTVEHIEAVLQHLQTLDAATPVTMLAALFHDAIYDPTAADNEERSAVLAIDQLARLGIDHAIIDDVAAIIRATAGHQLPQNPVAGMAEFLDADLSILGADAETYQRYAGHIREEYRHMSDDDYRAGRAQVLEHFAERDDLYFTAPGLALWDEAARRNLRAELSKLLGG